MADCVFCRIVSGEIAVDFEYQDEEVVAFKDAHPTAPVHILVIPRKHLSSLMTTTVEDQSILGKVQLIIKQLANKTGVTDGFKIELNAGRFQEVPHLHYHLRGGMNS